MQDICPAWRHHWKTTTNIVISLQLLKINEKIKRKKENLRELCAFCHFSDSKLLPNKVYFTPTTHGVKYMFTCLHNHFHNILKNFCSLCPFQHSAIYNWDMLHIWVLGRKISPVLLFLERELIDSLIYFLNFQRKNLVTPDIISGDNSSSPEMYYFYFSQFPVL